MKGTVKYYLRKRKLKNIDLYYFVYNDAKTDKRIVKSTGKHTKKEAIEYCNNFFGCSNNEERKNSISKHIPQKITENVSIINFQEACTIFLIRREEVTTRKSRIQVSSRYRNHLIPFFKDRDLRTITVEDIWKYKEYLSAKNLSDQCWSFGR